MTTALKLISKEQYLKTFLKNIGKRKDLTSLILFAISFLGCSIQNIKPKEVKWEYPPANPYPSVMKAFTYSDKTRGLIVELKPDSLRFDCTMRNDSPYYWCGINGLIKNPDPKLPEKVDTVFQRIVDRKAKKISIDLVNRLKQSNKPVFLVTSNIYHIENNEFGSLMFGIYNKEECMDLFYDFSACPKSAKKLDLYKGAYINP